MLAAHHANVKQFQQRMSSLNDGPRDDQLQELTREAERMLRPTMRLSSEMAQASDEVRKQANLLMSVTQSRTDPLTGLENKQSMEEALKGLFAMQARYNSDFAVVIVDIDQFKRLNDEHGHLFGDKILQQVADALTRSIRETDSIARFGGEEFIVTMQHTDLDGACIYAQRFRDEVSIDLPITVSIGVTGALEGDTVQSLLTRADTALYSAKSAGRNCVYRHDGDLIEPVELSSGLDVDDLDRLPNAAAFASKTD
jgi:diguanylate cyclase (GGDEF)-like protein